MFSRALLIPKDSPQPLENQPKSSSRDINSSQVDQRFSSNPQRYLTEKDLTLVSQTIGSKLPLLTCELGLPLSDWDYACNNFRLPDTQALYILRTWYSKEERHLKDLVEALETVGLSDVALKLV